ncbi:ALQxL family class IV lanthipeptide [Kitasatospora sp. NPDC056181]
MTNDVTALQQLDTDESYGPWDGWICPIISCWSSHYED